MWLMASHIESIFLQLWGGCWWPQKRASGWPEEINSAAASIITSEKAFYSQLASASLSARCTCAHLSSEYLKTYFEPSRKPLAITMNTVAATVNKRLKALEMEELLRVSFPGPHAAVPPAARSGRELRAPSPGPLREQDSRANSLGGETVRVA